MHFPWQRHCRLPCLTECKLPNKWDVFHLNQHETDFLYKEIFKDDSYSQNGIKLKENSVVFDIGANIGFFSLWAWERCNRKAKIYAFEPVPQTFEVLSLNSLRVNARDPSLPMKVFNFGISDEEGSVQFEFHPNMSIWSTSDPAFDEIRRKRIYDDTARAVNHSDNALLRFIPGCKFLYLTLARLMLSYTSKVEKVGACFCRLSFIRLPMFSPCLPPSLPLSFASSSRLLLV